MQPVWSCRASFQCSTKQMAVRQVAKTMAVAVSATTFPGLRDAARCSMLSSCNHIVVCDSNQRLYVEKVPPAGQLQQLLLLYLGTIVPHCSAVKMCCSLLRRFRQGRGCAQETREDNTGQRPRSSCGFMPIRRCSIPQHAAGGETGHIVGVAIGQRRVCEQQHQQR
jgi:hypothetical protein